MPRTRILTIFAFAAIYLIWGSTYLAIRIAVASVPALFAAGTRFLFAGAVLFVWALARGGALPSRFEWRNLAILATFLFLIAYGGVFWAEKSMPLRHRLRAGRDNSYLDGAAADLCFAKRIVPLVIGRKHRAGVSRRGCVGV